MLKLRDTGIITALSVGVLLSGCETTNSQMETTVYDMHRRIVRQERDLNDAVTKLNETTVDLSRRVEDSDLQTRRVASMQEEIQV